MLTWSSIGTDFSAVVCPIGANSEVAKSLIVFGFDMTPIVLDLNGDLEIVHGSIDAYG